MLADFNEYVGIPYIARGRSRKGADCYGLARIVLEERFGKSLPAFDDYPEDSPAEHARLIDENAPLLAGKPVSTPEPGDIVVMRVEGFPCHVGVYLGDGFMLHTFRAHFSVIERVDSTRWLKRIEGYYRV